MQRSAQGREAGVFHVPATPAKGVPKALPALLTQAVVLHYSLLKAIADAPVSTCTFCNKKDPSIDESTVPFAGLSSKELNIDLQEFMRI